MELEQTKTFTTGLFQQMQLISKKFFTWNQMIGGVLSKNSRESGIYGAFLRALCLMDTAYKFNNVRDFQSILHVNRGLMEICVDMIFQKHDASDNTANKIATWEDSSKLKAAECLLRYFERKQLALPDHCKAQKQFVEQNKERVQDIRDQLWGGKHPDRWTGKSLAEDVRLADQMENTNLEEVYETEYRKMNWFVHGAGMIAMRHINERAFYEICGIAYAECGKIALTCSRIALEVFGFFKDDIYAKEWTGFNQEVTTHIFHFLPRDQQEAALEILR